MREVHFQTDEEVYAAVSSTLRDTNGIDNPITRWNKCVAKKGDYIEK